MNENTRASVLVCVTWQMSCDRLIKTGKNIADKYNLDLQVACVQKPATDFVIDSGVIEYLYKSSKEVGAEMTVFFNDDAPFIISAFAKKKNAVYIVTGMNGNKINGFISAVHKLLPDVTISMVSNDNVVYNMCPQDKATKSNLKNKDLVSII